MRLKLTLKKTVVSLILGLVFASIFFALGFFSLLEFGVNIPAIAAIFLVSSILVYLLWSMFQREYDEDENAGEYVSMFEAIEEKDENQNNETKYQNKDLS